MTEQIGERLIYDGREVSMCSEPLGGFFAFGGRNPEFESNCTALWRGYVGTWEIVGDRLYIVSLSGSLKDGTEATLETVFPGYPDRVFAHWYSGTLRIPEGKQLEYVHMGMPAPMSGIASSRSRRESWSAAMYVRTAKLKVIPDQKVTGSVR